MLRANPVSDPAYYLTASGEWDRTGAWQGKDAERLGIAGTDDTRAFRKLMANRTPEGKKLTARDHPDRRCGYDLTFSEPKSVSIIRELAGDDRIERARAEATAEIMRDVVEPLAATRDRRMFGFRPATTGNLSYLTFQHRLGRPVNGVPDMNGHDHVVIPNSTYLNGRRTALEFAAIKEKAPLIQAAWHSLYARKLNELGYDTRVTKDGFEMASVSDATIRKFSGRTIQVLSEQERREAELQGKISRTRDALELENLYGKMAKVKSPKAKAGLGAKTRELKKSDIDPATLLAAWECPADGQGASGACGNPQQGRGAIRGG